MAKAIMVQGTASNVGKSLLVAGLCRIFRQDGHSVAPFKSQNMALNSFITREGLEIGRAQVVQAEAAGIEPSVLMNPILLKPTGEATSQVIVDGEVAATMGAAEYYARKAELIPVVRRAYATLASRHDILVIEGAGSPAEINLAENDIVNMGMAALAEAPVLLVGDIDRGGVFASLYGTVALLPETDRARIKGVIVNKFRGDVEILRPGLSRLEELVKAPVLGVVPMLYLDIDDEDSLSSRLGAKRTTKPVDVAVVRLPRISNFTDFAALDHDSNLGVRYVSRVGELARPDLVILPGTKNTMADLAWLRQNGLEAAIKKLVADGIPLIGICGGYQMLGETLCDPDGVEQGGGMRGMALLPVETRFARKKIRTRVAGAVGALNGFFACLDGVAFEGYEIHMGETKRPDTLGSFARITGDGRDVEDGAVAASVLGSYVHGLFDSGAIAKRLGEAILSARGESPESAATDTFASYKERQYDLLADALRGALDMDAIYAILG